VISKTTQVQAWMQSLAPGGVLVCSEHANNPAAMNSLRAAQEYIQELKGWGQVGSVRMMPNPCPGIADQSADKARPTGVQSAAGPEICAQ